MVGARHVFGSRMFQAAGIEHAKSLRQESLHKWNREGREVGGELRESEPRNSGFEAVLFRKPRFPTPVLINIVYFSAFLIRSV
jgi:hypothetical protein